MTPPNSSIQLLFVCTGNLCRSPFAEAWALRQLAPAFGKSVLVASAGLQAVVGAPPPDIAIDVALGMGVDMRGLRAKQLTSDLLRSARRVLVMERYHAEAVEEDYDLPHAQMLVSWAPAPIRPTTIPDPFRGESWAFEACYRLIADCVDRLLIDSGLLPSVPTR